MQEIRVMGVFEYKDVATFCTAYNFATNPDFSAYNYQVDWELVKQRCLANQQAQDSIKIIWAIDKLLKEEVTKYYNSFTTNCLQDVTEKLDYTYTSKEYHYTLYYYDQAGNLVQTVPPKGVNPLSPVQVADFLKGTISEPQHTLKTRYRYNSLNNLVWQETPDAGITQFWYDSKSQLRLSQNAQQSEDNRYSYTKYDGLGRVVEVGELFSEEGETALLAKVDDSTFPEAPAYALNDITRTHYDVPANISEDGFSQEYLRSRVSWTEVLVIPTAEPVATYYSYDIHGNVKSLLQKIPGLDSKQVEYVYDLVSGNVNYVMYQYGQPDQFIHRYEYDADNRIELVYSSADAFIWNKEAEYFYYPHGPLARIELGQYNVQGLDYYYTLQSWLKGVNLPHEGDPGGDGLNGLRTGIDEFAFTLGYYQNDYDPISASVITADARDRLWTRYNEHYGTQGLYNGNIAWMITDLPEVGRQQDDPAKSMQAMLYGYDQLNRITAARSLTSYTPGTGFAARTHQEEAYDTRYTYDPNGNLLTLQRLDGQGVLSDDFNYGYYSGTNRLRHTVPVTEDKIYENGAVVSDGKVYRNIYLKESAFVPSGSTVELIATEKIHMSPDFKAHQGANFKARIATEEDGNYQYDEIGNLIANLNEGIRIQWTPYGKVREVQKGDSVTINFKYDGSGNRIEKSIFRSTDTLLTRYIRDASGNVMAIYNDTVMTEQPIYGSSRLGIYRGSVMEGHRTLGHKNYELTNHLGNVLALVTDNIYMTQDSTLAKVVRVNDYYPFGLGMKGRSWNSAGYRYGFQGQEKDKEWLDGAMNFKYRVHDPRIGRFLSLDPLSSKFPFQSPYVFSSNRVIDMIELEGAETFRPFLLRPIGLTNVIDVSREAQVLRLKHPTWNDLTLRMGAQWNVSMGTVHTMLDIAGLFPGAGEPADVINGALYSLEGNGTDAALSFAGAAPIAGWAATTGKWSKNALRFSDNAFHTVSGLSFKLGSKHGNRLSHVIAHTANDLSKAKHGVFNVGDDLVNTLDEAWKMAQKGGDNIVKTVQDNGNVSYIIDMGREVGYEGGRKGSGEALNKINIVVEEGTSDVVTAFPTM